MGKNALVQVTGPVQVSDRRLYYTVAGYDLSANKPCGEHLWIGSYAVKFARIGPCTSF